MYFDADCPIYFFAKKIKKITVHCSKCNSKIVGRVNRQPKPVCISCKEKRRKEREKRLSTQKIAQSNTFAKLKIK